MNTAHLFSRYRFLLRAPEISFRFWPPSWGGQASNLDIQQLLSSMLTVLQAASAQIATTRKTGGYYSGAAATADS
jgi:hypothetical protein